MARKILQALGHLSTHNIKSIITMNSIKNYPVTVADIILAEKIFGKNIATLKRKLKRTTPLPVINNTSKSPKNLIHCYKQTVSH